MKISKNTTLLLLLTLTISNSFISCEKETVYQDVEIRPRVAHIQNNFEKLVKPLVEKPFLPEEVDKLASLKKKKIFYDEVMATAQIIGGQNYQPGEVEKPSIYTPIFSNHKTSVIHPQPQPINVPFRNRSDSFVFSSEGSHQTAQQLLSDQVSKEVSIPVNLGTLGSDPTLKGYETPEHKSLVEDESSFIQKKTNKNKNKFEERSPDDIMESDIKTFLKQFENTKDKADKLKVILEGKTRLLQDARELKEAIAGHLGELLDAKKLAVRLNTLVQKYEKKAMDDQKAEHLKLADEITVKELLKDRIHRQIQGLRVAPADEYKELAQADPADVTKLFQDVLKKLGEY